MNGASDTSGLPLVLLPVAITLIFGCTMAIALVACFWRIIDRSGRPGPLALLMLIPLVNIGVMLWAAFGEWPIEGKRREE